MERTQAGPEEDPGPVGAVDPTLATALKVFDLEDIAAAMQSLPERRR